MAYTIQDWIEIKSSDNNSKDKTQYQGLESEIIGSFCEALSQDTFQVKELLQDLEKYINNDDDLIGVSKALELLRAIFERAPKVSRHDIHVLIDYFVTRIENRENNPANNAGLGEIIITFRLFTKLEEFNSGDASLIIKSVFTLADERTRFKNLPESIRQDTYTIVDHIFREHSNDIIKKLGHNQLVDGLLQLVVFEKKASCLLLIFPLISYISHDWGLTDSNLEKLFASFIRYFPIKVGGMQNEATRISQKMSQYLSDCIVSNDFYASLVFPHLIENLERHSTLSASSLHEVFIATDACVKRFMPQTVTEWFFKIWESLKFQVWNGQNEDNISESLRIFRSIAFSLEREGSKWSQENSPLTRYIIQVTTECRDRIVDSPQKYLLSTGRVLYSVASSSHHSFYLVTKTILPSLIVLWQSLTLESEKGVLLCVINYILKAGIELLESSTTPLDHGVIKVVESLKVFQEGLLETLSNAIVKLKWTTLELSGINKEVAQDASCFVPALESIALLFRFPTYLTGVEKGMMIQELIHITMNFSKGSKIHGEGLLALQSISTFQPTVYADMILPILMENLPESLNSDDITHSKDLQKVASHLNDIAEISCLPCKKELDTGFPEGAISHYWQRNFDCFVQNLLRKIDTLFLLRNQVSYAKSIVAALLKGLKVFDGALELSHISETSPQPKILPYEFFWCQILDKVLTLSYYPEDHPCFKNHRKYLRVKTLPHENDKIDESFLELVGNILLVIARSRLNTPENNIVFKFFGASVDPEISSHTFCFEGLFAQQPISKSEPLEKLITCLALIYPLVGVQPDSNDDKFLTKTKLRLGIEKVGDLAVDTIHEILNVDHKITPRARITLLYYVQVLVSKFHCTRDRQQDGRKFIDAINSLVQNCSEKSQQHTEHVFQIIVYLAIASFACYDRDTMEPLFRLLCEGLNSEAYSSKTSNLVSQSFRMLLDNHHLLNEKNYIQVRSLRKGFILELTTSLFNQRRLLAKSEPRLTTYQHIKSKDNYIKAIIGIFGRVEHSLVLERFNIEELVELALDGTNLSDDDWAKAESIKLLRMLICDRPDFMQRHTHRVIERMIERTHNTLERPSDANVECRVLALEVLRLLIKKFGPSLDTPSRVRLMAELAVAKDDCHIDVRQAAAQCSLAWIYVKQ
ncbi:hypothetical protein K3495_g12082 [Podosphaera aphanis]|nr:hypothetical protein K3495_g12082 [Podosphaera aphanis]